VILGDAAHPQVPEASFDVVFLCTTLGEIPDRAAALAQCHRALKPGGVLSITEMFGDPHYQSRSVVQRFAEGAGFRLQCILGGWSLFTANFIKPCNESGVSNDKDHSLDGADREESDRLWSKRTLRLLPGACQLDLSRWSGSLKVKAVAISDDPPEFSHPVHRDSELCPVCGKSTAGGLRLGGSLAVEYERPTDWPFQCEPIICLGVWVHPSCFEGCQDTGRPGPMPW
jgi:SAM-dependent methyltransferase